MGIVHATAEAVSVDGDLGDDDMEEFDRALDLLRRSTGVRTPMIDVTGLRAIPSKAIGALVALWVDLAKEERWFHFRASDAVMEQLDRVGVAGVFLKRPEAPAT